MSHLIARRLVAVLAAVLAVASAALPVREVRAASVPLMQSIGGEQPIRLQTLDVQSDISGSTAATTLRMVFYNPNRRPLEGNLQFPLAAGQEVTGFALDINGKMRPAVPVEKSRGRQVFEAIERRGADPALLEATQGNNFKLRVFPVPAGGTRTVELHYAESLPMHGTDRAYRLPLTLAGELEKFSIDVKVHGAAKPPKLAGGLRELAFEPAGSEPGDFSAHLAKLQYTPGGTLAIVIPTDVKPHAYVQEFHGVDYFLAEVPVPLARSERTLPHVVGLLWDSSGSATTRNIEAELSVLDAYFRKMRDGEVRLTRLRDQPEAMKSFRIAGGDWSALRTALQQTVYDGASALSDWKPDPAVGEYLLVSDGMQNYGGDVFPTLAPSQRLYALDSATSDDAPRLAAWAQQNGGRLIRIEPHDEGGAAQDLLTEGGHLTGMRGEGVAALEAEAAYPAQGLLRIAGKLTGESGKLHLDVAGQGNSVTIDVPITREAPVHPLAARNWAAYRLRELDAERDLHRAEIRRLGLEFGIPSSETSLIVLESVADYVRYDIEPPRDDKPEFDRMRSVKFNSDASARRSQFDALVAAFQERQAWWQGKDVQMMQKPEFEARRAWPAAPGQAAVESPPLQPVPSKVIEARPSASPLPLLRSSAPMALADTAAPPAQYAGAPAAPMALRKSGAPLEAEGSTAAIHLQRWTANAPYMTRMKNAKDDKLYAVYLDEKPSYANSSAFFLDAADIFFERGQHDLGLRVLSNLAEMDLENRQVLRILAYRLMEAGAPELAIPILQDVQRLAEDEPHSFRDLGLAYAAAGHYQEAIDQLNEVTRRAWDQRFGDIALISVGELNAIAATHNNRAHPLDLSHVDARLVKNLPLDLRVVMGWDADDSDMDLWVTDPSGEKCYFQNTRTRQGGRISRDVTQGYGPEEFILHHAEPGKYKVEANFYGNRQQVVAGATTVQVKLTTGFGTTHAKDQMVTLRLRDRGDTVFVGEFEVKP